VNTIKLEIRKHHVTPGLNVLDLIIDANGEKIVKQTQHKDNDMAYKKFVEDIIKVAKELSNARIESFFSDFLSGDRRSADQRDAGPNRARPGADVQLRPVMIASRLLSANCLRGFPA